MTKKKPVKAFIGSGIKAGIAMIFMFVYSGLQAQVQYPSLSPRGEVSQIVGNTEVKIEYERPSARKRKVFGELVPWNRVWRTGAGNCTKISFSKDVKIEENTIAAGTYSVFSVPNPEKWMIIFNSDTTLYGSYDYDSAKDVIKFPVMSEPSNRFYETLTFDIDIIPNNARIYLSWENTQVSFFMQTSIDEELMKYIDDSLLTGKESDANRYSNAAEQLFYLNKRLEDAIALTNIAIEKNNTDGFARRVKMDLYEKLGQYENALRTVEEAIESEKDENELHYWRQHKVRIKKKL